MTRAAVIECGADFPDDAVWDDLDTLVATPGRNVAEAVVELLRTLGVDVCDPVEHEDHGWELGMTWRDGTFWMQVTVVDPGEAIIMTKDHSLGFFARLFGKKSCYPDFLNTLGAGLASDTRFSNVRWHRDFHLNGPAAPTPEGLALV